MICNTNVVLVCADDMLCFAGGMYCYKEPGVDTGVCALGSGI